MAEQKRGVNITAKENALEFLHDLHTTGIELTTENLETLKESGYIEKVVSEAIEKEEKLDKGVINDPNITGKSVSDIDKMFDIVEQDVKLDENMSIEDYRKLVENSGSVLFSGLKIDITQKDWRPESKINHAADFVEWIDSINTLGINKKTNYKKFNLYCQQAYQWIAEDGSISDYEDEDDRFDYMQQEVKRCAENTLYFMNKYLMLKESTIVVGMR